MAKVHDDIGPELRAFLERQPMFFVATAPLSSDGRVNVSPKGLDGTFAVLDPHRVAYLDLTGSGVETIAHLRENGRITVMFCAFDGPARIVRLAGRGTVTTCDEPEFAELAARFVLHPGARAVVTIDVERVADSCGYGVPRMELKGHRDLLTNWAAGKGDEFLADYRAQRNAVSIDGLPGF
jgi:predicted pyridoxine 5'-phosphate oxidase superfamily flavin-nucleotide-binding protein